MRGRQGRRRPAAAPRLRALRAVMAKKKKESRAATAEATRAAELAAKKRAREEAEERRLAEEAKVEIRYGMRINPYPAVPLEAPPAPPPLSATQQAAREAADEKLTAQIETNLDKYVEIISAVTGFSELGLEEQRMAARALKVTTYRAGDIIYDESEPGREAFVLEKGTVRARAYGREREERAQPVATAAAAAVAAASCAHERVLRERGAPRARTHCSTCLLRAACVWPSHRPRPPSPVNGR